MTSNDWKPSDPRRWDPNYGPIPVYGRSTFDRLERKKHKKCTARKLMKNKYRQSASMIGFKMWVKLQTKEGAK